MISNPPGRLAGDFGFKSAGTPGGIIGQSQASLYGASPMAARPNPFKFRA